MKVTAYDILVFCRTLLDLKISIREQRCLLRQGDKLIIQNLSVFDVGIIILFRN